MRVPPEMPTTSAAWRPPYLWRGLRRKPRKRGDRGQDRSDASDTRSSGRRGRPPPAPPAPPATSAKNSRLCSRVRFQWGTAAPESGSYTVPAPCANTASLLATGKVWTGMRGGGGGLASAVGEPQSGAAPRRRRPRGRGRGGGGGWGGGGRPRGDGRAAPAPGTHGARAPRRRRAPWGAWRSRAPHGACHPAEQLWPTDPMPPAAHQSRRARPLATTSTGGRRRPR